MSVDVTIHPQSHSDYARSHLTGRAEVDIQPGALSIDERRSRSALGTVAGILLGGLALFGMLALAMVAAHFGFDLMRMRQGTTLIAVLALAAGVAGFAGGST